MSTDTSGKQVTQMLFGPTAAETMAGQAQGTLLQAGLGGLSNAQAIAGSTLGAPVDYNKVATDQLNAIKNMPTDAARRQALGLGPNYVSGQTNPYNWGTQDPSEQDRIYKALLSSQGQFGTPADIAAAKANDAEEQQAEANYVQNYVQQHQQAVQQAQASPQVQLQNQLNQYLSQFATAMGQPSMMASLAGLKGMASGVQNIQDAANTLGPQALGATTSGLNLGLTSTQAIQDAANQLGPQAFNATTGGLNLGMASTQAIRDAANQLGPQVLTATQGGLNLGSSAANAITNSAAILGPQALSTAQGGLNLGTTAAQAIVNAANRVGPQSLDLVRRVLNQGLNATPEQLAQIQAISDAAQQQGQITINQAARNNIRNVVQSMPERGLFGGLNPETGQYQFNADIPDRFNQIGQELVNQTGNLATQLAQFRSNAALQYPLQASPTLLNMAMNANVPSAYQSAFGTGANLLGLANATNVPIPYQTAQGAGATLLGMAGQTNVPIPYQTAQGAGATLLGMAGQTNVPTAYQTAQATGANLMNMANATNVPTPFLSALGSNQQLLNSGMGTFATGVQPTLGQMLDNQAGVSSAFTKLNTMPWMGLQPAQSVFQSLLQPRMAQMSTTFGQSTGGVLPALQGAGSIMGGAGGLLKGFGSLGGA